MSLHARAREALPSRTKEVNVALAAICAAPTLAVNHVLHSLRTTVDVGPLETLRCHWPAGEVQCVVIAIPVILSWALIGRLDWLTAI